MSMMIHRHKVYKRGAVNKTVPQKIPQPKQKTEEVAKDEENAEVKYTKSEINRATTSTLKEIASEIGIDDADDKTGGELKKLIIEKLGL